MENFANRPLHISTYLIAPHCPYFQQLIEKYSIFSRADNHPVKLHKSHIHITVVLIHILFRIMYNYIE